MLTEIVLPLAILALAGWLLPRLLTRALPRSVNGLIVNGVITAVILLLVGIALFWGLYGASAGAVWQASPGHFLLLSARSALLWGPVLVLSLADLPRRWPPAEWALPGADPGDGRRGE